MTEFRSALVSGATGFIGRNLVRRLAQEEIRVYCLVRARRDGGSDVDEISGAERVEVDSFQPAELERMLTGVSAEVVFHLASYGVDQADRDPQRMISGNISPVSALLQVTSGWPLTRFIHTGSCSEYAPGSSQALITEDQPLLPESLYGAAKAAAAIFGNALAIREGTPFVNLRLFGVYGPGERRERLIPYLIDKLGENKPVDLTPGGQSRDLLYIDDVIDAYMAAARSEGMQPYRAYNVCSGKPVQIREIATLVAKAMDKPEELLRLGEREYRPDEPMWIVGDNTRFRSVTGWFPTVSHLEGITRMLKDSNPRTG